MENREIGIAKMIKNNETVVIRSYEDNSSYNIVKASKTEQKIGKTRHFIIILTKTITIIINIFVYYFFIH